MKYKLFVILFLLLTTSSFAQKKAVTETGDEVILYEDGTWKYKEGSEPKEEIIPLNPAIFKKNSKSTFLLKSTKLNMGVWLDPKKWSFKKATSDDDPEYQLQLRGKDLYAMIMTENIEVPLETLRTIAMQNAREASPDIKLVKQEYRMVNDKKILLLQMAGTIEGIKFTYYGYYFSNENGTLQFVTYTAQNLFNSLKAEVEDLLNGLVETEK